MKLSLMVTEGVHAGQVIAVNGISLLIGRGPQCHVRPNSPAVAERHCNLTLRGERAFVRDLDSRTGTFLNDRQLRGEIELRDGDFLRVGPLVFVIQLESSGEEPPVSENGSVPGMSAAYPAAETQEMPAFVPEPLPPLPAETQEMPALEPEPLPSEEPGLVAMAPVAHPPAVNGSRPASTRVGWGGPRRRRPHT
jgi:predicted component of type VI protein secretion system